MRSSCTHTDPACGDTGCFRSIQLLGAPKSSAAGLLLLGYLPVAEFLLYGILPGKPGLVQQLMITTVHLAIAWLSYVLLGIQHYRREH